MKRITLLFVCFLFGSYTFSQTEIQIGELNSEWHKLNESEELTFSVLKSRCDMQGITKPFEYVFISFQNNSSKAITVSYQLAMHFSDGTCAGCDESIENQREIKLNPGEHLYGECSFEKGELSMLIRNPLINSNGVEALRLELINLKVD